MALTSMIPELLISIRPLGVHHEKTGALVWSAAGATFTSALVSCDRRDFLRGLALLYGPWGVVVILSALVNSTVDATVRITCERTVPPASRHA